MNRKIKFIGIVLTVIITTIITIITLNRVLIIDDNIKVLKEMNLHK